MNFSKKITDTNKETENTELELDINEVLNHNSRLSTNFFDFAENSNVTITLFLDQPISLPAT